VLPVEEKDVEVFSFREFAKFVDLSVQSSGDCVVR